MSLPYLVLGCGSQSVANAAISNTPSVLPLQVLVGAHAVLANGGIQAPVGMHMVALAAKRHSIPFVVLVGLHKLSPLYPHDPDLAFNGEGRTRSVLDRVLVLTMRLMGTKGACEAGTYRYPWHCWH